MGGVAMRPTEVDFSDVQGLLRFGYGKMKSASYALLRIKDARAARAWLRAAPITNAVAMNPPPVTAMQVAFTAAGLRALDGRPQRDVPRDADAAAGRAELLAVRLWGGQW